MWNMSQHGACDIERSVQIDVPGVVRRLPGCTNGRNGGEMDAVIRFFGSDNLLNSLRIPDIRDGRHNLAVGEASPHLVLQVLPDKTPQPCYEKAHTTARLKAVAFAVAGQIRFHHLGDHLFQRGFRLPAKRFFRFAGIAQKNFNFCWAQEGRVGDNVIFVIQAN